MLQVPKDILHNIFVRVTRPLFDAIERGNVYLRVRIVCSLCVCLCVGKSVRVLCLQELCLV